MYPSAFDYHAPQTIAEALALLDQYQDDAKVLGGSMSLVPLLKLRLASPKHLVDLRKVPAISETIDWAKAVLLLGGSQLDKALVKDTLGLLLKHHADVGDVDGKLDTLLAAAERSAEASPSA